MLAPPLLSGRDLTKDLHFKHLKKLFKNFAYSEILENSILCLKDKLFIKGEAVLNKID